MEKRLSYTLGFDIANPDGGRAIPIPAAGHFSIDQNVPAFLRGPAGGFMAAVLIRPRLSRYGSKTPNIFEYIAGSYDFTNETGWCIVWDGFAGVITAFVGDIMLTADMPVSIEDALVMLNFEPGFSGGAAALYVNGDQQDTLTPTGYATGPNNFGIGGTVDESYVTENTDTAFGALSVHIGGVLVGPNWEHPTPTTPLGNRPAVEQFAEISNALDVVNTPVSPIPGANPEVPAASHIFSTRRGLPQLVDNGDETWVDQVAGTELTRVGTQVGATVSAWDHNWTSPDPNN